MSHAVNKQNLHELLSVYATNLERNMAELEKELDTVCIAVFDNRGKAITNKTLDVVRCAVSNFNLPLRPINK
tara:strand:- start:159 stop:374 length:216 start_codon:yes stop_codon:yes gene_type:complete